MQQGTTEHQSVLQQGKTEHQNVLQQGPTEHQSVLQQGTTEHQSSFIGFGVWLHRGSLGGDECKSKRCC